ncbi:Protein PLANT CADMIUM RESISTANCE 2 [Linum perenne]
MIALLVRYSSHFSLFPIYILHLLINSSVNRYIPITRIVGRGCLMDFIVFTNTPGPQTKAHEVCRGCLTIWCPCVTFGRIAEIVDQGSTSCGLSGTLYVLMMWMLGCACIFSCFYRAKMRRHFHLEEKPCADCCVHLFCEGWHGNMERNRRLATMAPTIEGGMSREERS